MVDRIYRVQVDWGGGGRRRGGERRKVLYG